MYITCQQEMDFGEAYNNVMNRRLNKYFLKSLPHVEQEANQWLQEHAMDCICLGPKDGSRLLHRHIDAEGLVACEQAHLFGYREPAKRGKVS